MVVLMIPTTGTGKGDATREGSDPSAFRNNYPQEMAFVPYWARQQEEKEDDDVS